MSKEKIFFYYQVAIVIAVFIIFMLLGYIIYSKTSSNRVLKISDQQPTYQQPTERTAPLTSQPSEQPNLKTTCIDVTSYDYNWNNDMKCTRPDGSTFYTNYSGARKYE